MIHTDEYWKVEPIIIMIRVHEHYYQVYKLDFKK